MYNVNATVKDRAKQLVANAKAYQTYVEGTNKPLPVVVKVDSNPNAFEIYYYEVKYTDAVTGKTGKYTNFKDVSVSGATQTGTTQEVNRQINGSTYNRKRTYNKSGSATTANITINYEQQRSLTNLKYIDVADKDVVEMKKTSKTYNSGAFVRISSGLWGVIKEYYHENCVFMQNGCKHKNLNAVEELASRHAVTKYAEGYGNIPVVYTAKEKWTCDCGATLYWATGTYTYEERDPETGIMEVKTANIDNVYYFRQGEQFSGFNTTISGSTSREQNVLYGTGTKKSDTITDTFKFIQPVELTFNKKDFSGNTVNNATINIVASSNVTVDGAASTTITIGSGKKVKVMPKDANSGTFTLTLTETAPTGYKPIPTTTLTVTYDNGAVTGISSTQSTYVSGVSSTKTITIKNRPAVRLTFNKKDFSNYDLGNAKIKITGIDKVSSIDDRSSLSKELTSNSNGQFGTIIVYPNDTSGEFKIKIEETVTPNGYQPLPKTVELKVKYNIDTGAVISVTNLTDGTTEYIGNTTNKNITVKNRPQIEKLTLLKTSSQGATKIEGATFDITLENVLSIGNYSVGGQTSGNIIITGIKTDSNGNLIIEDLVIKDPSKEVYITIEETSAVRGYKRMEGKIKLTLKREGPNYSSYKREIVGNVLSTEFTPESSGMISNHEITLGIKNIPVMNLGGIVWEDTQSGNKNVAGPDGIYNNDEQGMPGIEIELYKSNGEKVTKDVYGKNLMIKTANGGETVEYKLFNGGTSSINLSKGQYVFTNIEKGDYYIRFTYDGINYQTVKLSSDVYANNNESKASEIDREGFNAKFTTISAGKATGSKGDIGLTYVDSTPEGAEVKTSKLVTYDQNGNLKEEFKMRAKTNNYVKSGDDWKTVCWNSDGTINTASYAQDINCGLTYRKFDLALGMDIHSAKLTINGKETTYDYNQIIDSGLTDPNNDLQLDEWLNMHVSSETKNDELPYYNLYLYLSDYNYRISDYKTDANEKITGNETQDGDAAFIKDSENDPNKELRAFITYKVILKNQTAREGAQVNQLAYYYDNNYTFVSATKADGTPITFVDDTSLPQIANKKSARVSNFATNLGEAQDYRQELYFTFEVKKDGSRFLTKDIECANLAEIISYSTTQGFIDNDSAPGNMKDGNSIRFEDDTDQAKGIKLSIKNERERIIKGTVFDDKERDGKKDGNTGVNDVIVQLIEIKNINSQYYYEYIWQETKSGSNQVKTTARNGYAGQTYNNSVTAGSGEYEFQDFIPGNYIIRFIYGDGSTYDMIDNDDVRTYNGQDYKSTIDEYYTKAWYMTKNYDSVGTDSVARDNESRRLEVMAYSTKIDGAKGAALEVLSDGTNLNDEAKANLVEYCKSVPSLADIDTITDGSLKRIKKHVSENTWMCAETSRINVPVDDERDVQKEENKASPSSKTDYGYAMADDDDGPNPVVYENVHFGLTLRPEAKLVLEKHITGLKITPSGVGSQPVIDAKANIEGIVNGDAVETTGAKVGLATIKSDRGNRGFWKVETDIEELAQGAELEAEYTYVIRNDGEKDYLSTYLVNSYKEAISTDGYPNLLKNEARKLRTDRRTVTDTTGKFLGDFYYTGKVPAETDEDQTEVVARVETIEEALTNRLKYEENVAGESFKALPPEERNEYYKVYDVEGNPDTEKIETVVQTSSASKFLTAKEKDDDLHTETTADWNKTLKLTTVLSSLTGEEGYYPSHIAEILEYSNASGRRDMASEPENLNYVHSEESGIIIKDYNQEDEFWGETIIISKPTGANKQLVIQIALITISGIAVIGAGIVLIKKFVLKK